MAPPRRQPLEQARRLVPPPKPARRFVGPLVLAGLALGLTAYAIAAVLAPARPAIDAAVVAQATPAPDVQGVPQSEATATSGAAGAPGASVAAAPTPDPRVVNEKRLREAVFAPFRPHQGTFGIAVKDLGTGMAVLLNEHFPFQAASLYKLPVMYEVFKQREERALTFGEELTIGADDAAMDLGSLFWPVGTRITVGTALERMVTISDNSGAFMLSKRVGSRRINDDVESIGLRRTYIQGETLSTSPGDMLRLLELLAQGEAVNRGASAEMIHLMARQQVRDRIPYLLPPEATVANKTGNWEGAAHDVALIYGPRSTMVIAYLSDGVVDFDGVYEAMRQSARNVYDLLNDPDFGTTPMPLPPGQVASYTAPAKLPVASAPQPKPATSGATNASGGTSAGSGSASGATSGASSGAAATNGSAGAAATRPPAPAPPTAVAQPTAATTTGAPAAPGQQSPGQPGTPPPARPPVQPGLSPARTPTPPPAAPNGAPAGAPAAPAAAPAAPPIVKPSGPTIFAPAPPGAGGAPAPTPTKAPQ